MAIADDIKQLRQQLDLTQEQLGQKLGVAGRVVRRWEAKVHHPDPKYLLGLASLAQDAKLPLLAMSFRSALIRDLGLIEREMSHASFDVPTREAMDHERRFKYNEPCGPPRGMLLVVRHGKEETSFLQAVFHALRGLRSEDESERERARAALKQLSETMGVEV